MKDNPIKSHIDTAILAAHAALARAAHSPFEASEILLDAMDELEKALDLLEAEQKADEAALAAVAVDQKKARKKAA